MGSTEADNIDKLYKNYDILSDAKDKISEVSFPFTQTKCNAFNIQKKASFPNRSIL